MLKVLNLRHMPGQQSMLVFHALARIGFEGLVIVSPKTPLASIGYFQDASKEVDLNYCKKVKVLSKRVSQTNAGKKAKVMYE